VVEGAYETRSARKETEARRRPARWPKPQNISASGACLVWRGKGPEWQFAERFFDEERRADILRVGAHQEADHAHRQRLRGRRVGEAGKHCRKLVRQGDEAVQGRVAFGAELDVLSGLSGHVSVFPCLRAREVVPALLLEAGVWEAAHGSDA
jgi:hypothetical protein